jgi:hypothetical protein
MKFLRKTKYYESIVYEWNLPSGYTCPFAQDCLVKVDRHTGKFQDFHKTYKCYSAVAERFPAVRNHRWSNFTALLEGKIPKIPKQAKAIRIHASGDFYNQKYFDTWLDICRENPNVEFWAYTKSLNYWVNRIDTIPNNLTLTASKGGKHDYLIDLYSLKNVEVIADSRDAKGRPIDTCDDQARLPGVNFCLIDNFAN